MVGGEVASKADEATTFGLVSFGWLVGWLVEFNFESKIEPDSTQLLRQYTSEGRNIP